MPPPRFRHGRRQLRIGSLLDHFVDPRELGRVLTETGVITERDPDSVRGPDVVFWSAQRLPLDFEPELYPEIAPDLCVEILSPDEWGARLRRKIAEYFKSGVRMVWVVDPEKRIVRVYRSPGKVRILRAGDILSGEDVIPGFECRIEQLFA